LAAVFLCHFIFFKEIKFSFNFLFFRRSANRAVV
jgi:hypothetical protein